MRYNQTPNCRAAAYLNKVLGREFRDLFLKRLAKKIEQGKIVPEDTAQIASVIQELSVIDWAVYIQGPPKRDCGGELILKYLTRYMTGGPISSNQCHLNHLN